jgi:hypothetical protein
MPSELRRLTVQAGDLQVLLAQLEDLQTRLNGVTGTLRSDVELVSGTGFSVEGVVCVRFHLFLILSSHSFPRSQ